MFSFCRRRRCIFHAQKAQKPQSRAHVAASLVFLYYLVGVFTMTGIGRLKAFSPRLVLVPFRDMISGPVDTLLNILLFVPLGIFLPIMYKRFNNIISILTLGFMLSLTIELVQMFGRGTSDVNDLITNTAGTCLGFGIYKISAANQPHEKFRASVNDFAEISLFATFSLMIMITVQPVVIHELFGLGRSDLVFRFAKNGLVRELIMLKSKYFSAAP